MLPQPHPQTCLTPMANNIYSDLQDGQIRLLELAPARDDDDDDHVRCELVLMSLHSASQYEALSYEWGSPEDSAWVTTNGVLVQVRKTLRSALKALRNKDTSRLLWADGLCINQEDKDEVGIQLDMMDAIYERSKAVLVWLGCATPVSTRAIAVLKPLALLARQHNGYRGMQNNNWLPFILTERPRHSSVFVQDDDMHILELGPNGQWNVITLARMSELSDDDVFKFHDSQLWYELDALFGHSYFDRTWIQREIAKAPCIRIYRGRHPISWPLFASASVGRNILHFQPGQPEYRSTGALISVIDARERWRTPEHHTTLAGALVALSYSRESLKHDHIHAAYAMSKHQIPWLEQPLGCMKIEDLMLRTTCACIEERNDLYHLGQWSVTRRKAMKLPTWAPDFTSGICELAVEHASVGTGKLIEGAYNICGSSLCLDAHLLDSIRWSCIVADGFDMNAILRIFEYINTHFEVSGRHGLFEEYIVSRKYCNTAQPTEVSKLEMMNHLSQAEALLRDSKWCPDSCPDQLMLRYLDVQRQPASSCHSRQLNIEALWSVLNPCSDYRKRPKAYTECQHLVLAWLYLAATHNRGTVPLDRASYPKVYSSLVAALVPTLYLGLPGLDLDMILSWTGEFIGTHLSQTTVSQYEPECVFVTESGFLGRTAAGEACKGDVVAFLGGGWTPYILEHREQNYGVKSFAFVEGLSELEQKPSSWKIERICLV